MPDTQGFDLASRTHSLCCIAARLFLKGAKHLLSGEMSKGTDEKHVLAV
jgi:hypothetical protein